MLTTEGKSMLTEKQQPFSLGGTEIQPGQRAVVDIPFGKLYTQSPTAHREAETAKAHRG